MCAFKSQLIYYNLWNTNSCQRARNTVPNYKTPESSWVWSYADIYVGKKKRFYERAYQRILFGVASRRCGEIKLIAEKCEYSMPFRTLSRILYRENEAKRRGAEQNTSVCNLVSAYRMCPEL